MCSVCDYLQADRYQYIEHYSANHTLCVVQFLLSDVPQSGMADSSDIYHTVDAVCIGVCVAFLVRLLMEMVKDKRNVSQRTDRKDDMNDKENDGSCVDNMEESSGESKGSTNGKSVKDKVREYEQSIDTSSQDRSSGKSDCGTKRSKTSVGLSTIERRTRNDEVSGAEKEGQTNWGQSSKASATGTIDQTKQREQKGQPSQEQKDHTFCSSGTENVHTKYETTHTLSTTGGKIEENNGGEGGINAKQAEDVEKEICVNGANTDGGTKAEEDKTRTAEKRAEGVIRKESGKHIDENLARNSKSRPGKEPRVEKGSEAVNDEDIERQGPGENEGESTKKEKGEDEKQEDGRRYEGDERCEKAFSHKEASTLVNEDHRDIVGNLTTVQDVNSENSGEDVGTKNDGGMREQGDVKPPESGREHDRGKETGAVMEISHDTESSGNTADKQSSDLEDSSEDRVLLKPDKKTDTRNQELTRAEDMSKNTEGDGREKPESKAKEDQVKDKIDIKSSNEDETGDNKGADERAFRSIKVTIMTSLQESTVSGLVSELRKLKDEKIGSVNVLNLPYSGLDRYHFEEPVEFMILCHSIHNRRFGLTDVLDSIYDDFLPYCEETIGKENIVVIAHDFDDSDSIREVRMKTFSYNQPTTFRTSGLVLLSGKLDRACQVAKEDWKRLVDFIHEAAKLKQGKSTQQENSTLLPDASPSPPTSLQVEGPSSAEEVTILAGRGDSGAVDEKMTSPLPEEAPFPSGKPTIRVCTSLDSGTVDGLVSRLQQAIENVDVKVLNLPYSGLDNFEFPSEVVSSDVMILCHSINNRGLSITNVPNSVYDKYLEYSSGHFGKEKVAVIVHDFKPFQGNILDLKMTSFKREQPSTSLSAGLVLLCGRFDGATLETLEKDWNQLVTFVRNATK